MAGTNHVLTTAHGFIYLTLTSFLSGIQEKGKMQETGSHWASKGTATGESFYSGTQLTFMKRRTKRGPNPSLGTQACACLCPHSVFVYVCICTHIHSEKGSLFLSSAHMTIQTHIGAGIRLSWVPGPIVTEMPVCIHRLQKEKDQRSPSCRDSSRFY